MKNNNKSALRWIGILSIFWILILTLILFTFKSCIHTEKDVQDAIDMFESFDKADNIIILTAHELVIHNTQYKLDDIKYKEQQCNIVFLEEDGFYSYIHNPIDLSVEFLFTRYEDFETISLGTETTPSKVLDGYFINHCFLLWMDDPRTDEPKKMYYSWCVDTKEADYLEPFRYVNSMDGYRSEKYTFTYESNFFGGYLDVTDNETGVTKRIDKSILKTFDEGKKIRKTESSTVFNITQVFEDNGTIYISSIFGVGFLGYPSYGYVYTWNFETEECNYFTSIYFEDYPEWFTDMYIQSN